MLNLLELKLLIFGIDNQIKIIEDPTVLIGKLVADNGTISGEKWSIYNQTKQPGFAMVTVSCNGKEFDKFAFPVMDITTLWESKIGKGRNSR